MTIELDLILLACVAAAATDLLWRKIPNVIPIAVAVAGFGFAAGRGVAPALIFIAIVVAVLVLGTVAIAPERPITMPYALAIACGVATVALSHSVAPFLRLPI